MEYLTYLGKNMIRLSGDDQREQNLQLNLAEHQSDKTLRIYEIEFF